MVRRQVHEYFSREKRRQVHTLFVKQIRKECGGGDGGACVHPRWMRVGYHDAVCVGVCAWVDRVSV